MVDASPKGLLNERGVLSTKEAGLRSRKPGSTAKEGIGHEF
jgi:hypothetical protein